MRSVNPSARACAPLPLLVERAGRRHPAAVVPLRVALADAVVVLDGPGPPLDPAVTAAGAAHLAALRRARPGTHDGPVLSFVDLEGSVVRAVRGGYFAMIAACDGVRAELDAAGVDGAGSSGADSAGPGRADVVTGSPAGHDRPDVTRWYRPDPPPLDALPLRALVHAAAGGDPLASGAGRAAGLGVSVVTTVPGRAGRSVVLGRRSGAVATDSGLWHIAPSGMLEDLEGGVLAGTVALELSEELGVGLPVAEIAARVEVLGLVHDLTRLRADLAVRLDLTAAEAETITAPPGGEFDALRLVGVDPAGFDALWREHPPERLTPAGAGALALLEDALHG